MTMRTRAARNAKRRLAPSPPPSPKSALTALVPDPGELPDRASHLRYLAKHPHYTSDASWSIFMHLSIQRLQVRRYNRAVSAVRAAPRGMSVAESREWARKAFPGIELPEEGDAWGAVREEIWLRGAASREGLREMEELWRIVEAWDAPRAWDERKAICWAHYEKKWMRRLRVEMVAEIPVNPGICAKVQRVERVGHN